MRHIGYAILEDAIELDGCRFDAGEYPAFQDPDKPAYIFIDLLNAVCSKVLQIRPSEHDHIQIIKL